MIDGPTTTPSGEMRSPARMPASLGAAVGVARALALPSILALGVLLALGHAPLPNAVAFVIVLALAFVPLVALAWLSLRSRTSLPVRRAVRPVEAGLLAGLVVSLFVALLGAPVTESLVSGGIVAVVATIVTAFALPLVEQRRRGRRIMAGVLVAVIALGGWGTAFFIGAFDRYDDIWYGVDESAGHREVLRRIDDGGVRLGAPGQGVSGAPLAAGHVDGTLLDGSWPTPYASDPAMQEAVPADGPGAVVAGSPSRSHGRPASWATLRARPDGRLELALDRGIADGIDSPIVVRVQRGSCHGDVRRTPVDTWTWGAGAGGVERRLLSLRLQQLRVGAQLSVVAGVGEPLSPTRCADLVSPTGLALASHGAARFHVECVGSLELAPGDRDLLAPSSFADPRCARRLEELAGFVRGAVVPSSSVAQVRRCLADRRLEAPPVERPVAGGVAFTRTAVSAVDDPLHACAGTWMEEVAWPVGPYGPSSAVPAGAAPASAVMADLDGEDPAAVADSLR